MRSFILLIIFLAFGCKSRPIPKAQVATEKKHFDTVVRPQLEAELARVYSKLPKVSWTDEYTQQNASHNESLPAPPPTTNGVSFHLRGIAGKAKVHITGTYILKDKDSVFGTIEVNQDGSWTRANFPAKALQDLGWPQPIISSLKYRGSGVKWRGSVGDATYDVDSSRFQSSDVEGVPESEFTVEQLHSSITLVIPR